MGAMVPPDTEKTRTVWFALLLTLTNGFLDAYTYFTRGGVFANVQTGNVIFFAIDVADRKIEAALNHVWPLLAFITGVALAAHIKSGRVERFLPRSLRWTITVQVAALAMIGFVPATVPHSYVTVPISFLAAVQIGLFRNIGDLNYMPVATTGNMMRMVEAGYDGFVDKNALSARACRLYAGLIATFALGAVIGAVTSRAWGVHAIWFGAASLFLTLVLFVVDERRRH